VPVSVYLSGATLVICLMSSNASFVFVRGGLRPVFLITCVPVSVYLSGVWQNMGIYIYIYIWLYMVIDGYIYICVWLYIAIYMYGDIWLYIYIYIVTYAYI